MITENRQIIQGEIGRNYDKPWADKDPRKGKGLEEEKKQGGGDQYGLSE